MYEKIIFEQMSGFFANFLWEQQCHFRKEYIIQHCLSNLLEKWKNSVDKGKSFGALLADFQRHLIVSTMNCLLQNSMHMDLIYLIHDHLSNRKQWTKIDDDDKVFRSIFVK